MQAASNTAMTTRAQRRDFMYWGSPGEGTERQVMRGHPNYIQPRTILVSTPLHTHQLHGYLGSRHKGKAPRLDQNLIFRRDMLQYSLLSSQMASRRLYKTEQGTGIHHVQCVPGSRCVQGAYRQQGTGVGVEGLKMVLKSQPKACNGKIYQDCARII